MTDLPIKDYMDRHGVSQTALAKQLGLKTQSAISQMLRSDRQIYIRQTPLGVTAYEVKAVGTPRSLASA